jgi:hypothetical protein
MTRVIDGRGDRRPERFGDVAGLRHAFDGEVVEPRDKDAAGAGRLDGGDEPGKVGMIGDDKTLSEAAAAASSVAAALTSEVAASSARVRRETSSAHSSTCRQETENGSGELSSGHPPPLREYRANLVTAVQNTCTGAFQLGTTQETAATPGNS